MASPRDVPLPPGDGRTVSYTSPRVGGRLEGKTIGSYTLLNLLGQGGMGSVFLAEHLTIGRKAAIKILDPDIAADPEAVSRFFTEARAVNDIRHPNIVEVTDFGHFDGLYCIVMEYLEGETLAARLVRERQLDEATVVRITRQCLSALGAAHDRGLVHRDLKPENIFLRAHPDYPDFVKLLDFGIAKLLAPDTVAGHQTKAGAVLGTPAYMSPEQCLGESALDIRSDIYSLGVVIYQMLTGRTPFFGDTLGRLIVCHVSENAIPPRVLNPAVSRAMNDVVMRALQKKPKDRQQTARELRDAVERVLSPGAAPQARVATPMFGVNVPGGLPLGSLASGSAVPAARPALTPTTAVLRPMAAGASGPLAPASTPTPVAVAPSEMTGRLLAVVRERVASGQIRLPELSPAAHKCIELARAGRLGFSDAAKILNTDPALRSRIMRLANSAAFPSLMPATTLDLAVARLGAQGLFNALIELAAREALEGDQPRVRDLMRRIWPHALGTAVMSADLRQRFAPSGGGHGGGSHGGGSSGGDGVANAYLAGLMSAIGKPIVGAVLIDIDKQMERAGHRRALAEPVLLAVIEAGHAAAGAALCRHWELPAEVVTAVEQHGGWRADNPRALCNLVRFSSAWTSRLGLTFGICNGPEIDRTYGEGRALLGIDDTTVKGLSYGFKERVTVLSQIRG